MKTPEDLRSEISKLVEEYADLKYKDKTLISILKPSAILFTLLKP